MLLKVRQILALLLAVVVACGGASAVSTTASAHAGGHHAHAATVTAGSHSAVERHHGGAHGRDHRMAGHEHHHDRQATAAPIADGATTGATAGPCRSDEGCLPGAGHDGPCCHVHASCCCWVGFVPACSSLEARGGAGAKLAAIDAALPHGGIIHPLLRPPRRTA